MERVLLHTCCAPCSLSCIDPLRSEGIEPVAFWYNPNIHPWKEYQARRDCLLAYAPTIGMEVRVQEDYGLKDFVRHVAGDIDHRCAYCYEHRLEGTAKYAAEHGFTAFTSTLLASTYQNHEAIAAAAAHRPRNPQSEAHRSFCRRQLERIAALPEIDFRSEASCFRRCLEINS